MYIPSGLSLHHVRIVDRPPHTRWLLPVLIFLVWVVYSPGLERMFWNDQIWYLAELNGDTSIAAGLSHWDYGATRRYWRGDEALFHPLWFVWLALLNSLFAYHFTWWNAAGLALHVLVGAALYRALLAIAPSRAALAATLLFMVHIRPRDRALEPRPKRRRRIRRTVPAGRVSGFSAVMARA
jgi:hypothetical protein